LANVGWRNPINLLLEPTRPRDLPSINLARPRPV